MFGIIYFSENCIGVHQCIIHIFNIHTDFTTKQWMCIIMLTEIQIRNKPNKKV